LALNRSQDDSPGGNVRVILFDVGGVLVELSGVATILEWTQGALTAEDVWRIWLSSPTVRAFETGRSEADAFAADVVRELGLNVTPQQFLAAFARWPTGLYPGAMQLLARIPRRYRRALLSNSNVIHWPRVTGEMGLTGAVDHCFVSHLTGKIKPDADAFDHALHSLACAPEHVLFLDDNLLNVEAAQRLGLRAAVVRGPAEAEQELRRAGIFEE